MCGLAARSLANVADNPDLAAMALNTTYFHRPMIREESGDL